MPSKVDNLRPIQNDKFVAKVSEMRIRLTKLTVKREFIGKISQDIQRRIVKAVNNHRILR